MQQIQYENFWQVRYFIFNKSEQDSDYQLILDGTNISRSQNFKYLGFTIPEDPLYFNHIDDRLAAAQKT